MPLFTLQTERRGQEETGKGPVGRMRRGGTVPGVVYGLHQESIAIKFDERTFEVLQKDMMGMGVIELDLGGERIPTLLKAIHRHPVTRRPLNVDFQRVDLSVPINGDVWIILTATPREIAADEIFIHDLRKVPVTGPPAEIPASVRIDASQATIRQPLHVSDLPLPPGVTPTVPPETVVAGVQRAEIVLLDADGSGEQS